MRSIGTPRSCQLPGVAARRRLSTLSSALGLALVVAASGCVVEADPGPSPHADPGTTTPPSGSAPTTPPLLSLDTGRTLTAQPGAGAGLFVTYRAGGHWSLQWTCDTNASRQSCAFDVSVSASSIASYAVTPGDATVTHAAGSFRAQTTTGATLDGATFDTAPGAPIVLSASINGAPAPNLVFYVSDGKLATAPTDPIELVPTTP